MIPILLVHGFDENMAIKVVGNERNMEKSHSESFEQDESQFNDNVKRRKPFRGSSL